MSEVKRRGRGRPLQEPMPGKLVQLGILVRADVKALLIERASRSGRTMSREAEMLIERCLVYDSAITAGRVEELKRACAERKAARRARATE